MLIVGYVSKRDRPQGKMQSSFGPTFSRNVLLVLFGGPPPIQAFFKRFFL